MTPAHVLAHVRVKLREMTEALPEEPSREELVEAGTALAAIVTAAKDSLEQIKGALRADALKDLGYEPGSVNFEGLDIGQVSVTVPKPKLALVRNAKVDELKDILGEDFDTFFATKVAHTPHRNAGELVVRLATGPKKDALLENIEEKPQTPRVSFRKA